MSNKLEFVVSKVDDLLNWARKGSLWPMTLVFSIGLYLFFSYYMNYVLPEKIDRIVEEKVSSALARLSEASMVTPVVPEIPVVPEKKLFWFIYQNNFYFFIAGAATVFSFYVLKQPENTEALIQGICVLRDCACQGVNSLISGVYSFFRTIPPEVHLPPAGMAVRDPFMDDHDYSGDISPGRYYRLRQLYPLMPNYLAGSGDSYDGSEDVSMEELRRVFRLRRD